MQGHKDFNTQESLRLVAAILMITNNVANAGLLHEAGKLTSD